MATALPSVPIELGDQEYSLVASFFALKSLREITNGKNIEDFLNEDAYEAIPALLEALMSHLDNAPSRETIQKNVGPANAEEVCQKIAEAMAAGANPTRAKVRKVTRTGGASKPSQTSN